MKMTSLDDLPTPCFVVDFDKAKANAKRMQITCKSLKLKLRPHMKTHKTLEAADLQTNYSKRCIAVSTLAEAEFYADNGFDDILLAHPVSQNKIDRCLALVEKLSTFHVLVSNTAGLDVLETAAPRLSADRKWSVMLEIDAGYGRTGFPWDQEDIDQAAKRIAESSSSMRLESLYIHCGNAYSADTAAHRQQLQGDVVSRAKAVQSRMLSKGIKVTCGTGSTPTCSLPDDGNQFFSEFHPGNYIFYDYQQYLVGSCRQSHIACRVMTRVIDHKPEHNTVVVDCGFTALSHDGMRSRPSDFCVIEGESNLRLAGMSQEIGKIVAKEGDLDCRNYPIGTILFIIPYHSCATAALHPKYFIHSGSEVTGTWTPCRGW